MAVLSCHPKSPPPPFLGAKRITVWPMYQTSLSHTFSQGQSHPSLTPSKSSVLPLAAWLMTFILMEMEKEETALDADLDTHVYLRQADINLPATFLASMLCDTHTNIWDKCIHSRSPFPCSFLSPNWPPVKISLIL